MSAANQEPRTYTARWVFPVSAPPIPNGTVTVRGETIESIDLHGGRRPDEDLGNAAIIPGLVNAHTHLDLSGARGLVPPTDPAYFTDWLRGVIAYRRSRTPEQVQVDIRAGLTECLRAGTTLVGDISADGGSWDVVAVAPVRAVVFRELIGLSSDRAVEALEVARRWLADRGDTPTVRSAISPHAPYSVRGTLFAEAGKLLRETKKPLAVHLAESHAEMELIEHHRGPFVGFLKGLGVWDERALIDRLMAVMGVCDFRQPKLFVHGNYLAPWTCIPRNSTIVYCPRTHAAFGHPPHPFREFLGRGVRVCLGTDSLASNPDLDILAEARFVHGKYPDFPGESLLRMVTLAGAEALGRADEVGSLEPGKAADLVSVPLPDSKSDDPYGLLFADHPGGRRTLFRGIWRN